METTLTPSLRKAAVLMRSLDADSAAVLLAQLSNEEARAVRQAMRELGSIDPEEQEELRHSLRPAALPAKEDDGEGVELALTSEPESLLDAYPAMDYSAVMESMVAAPVASDQPFGWLELSDLPSLASMLEREHLSTVAVVLSHLPADQASQVLAALPPSRRSAALQRLADLGESDRESLEVIERELAEWIQTQKAERRRRADRLHSIQAILRHSNQETCREVMQDLAQHDELLAAELGPVRSEQQEPAKAWPVNRVARQIEALQSQRTPLSMPAEPPRPQPVQVAKPQPKPVVAPKPEPQPVAPPAPIYPFECLAELTREQIAQVFRECRNHQVVLALAGASQRVSDHVESLLPKTVARELRRRMHALASVTLSEIETAQNEVAAVAGRRFGDRIRVEA